MMRGVLSPPKPTPSNPVGEEDEIRMIEYIKKLCVKAQFHMFGQGKRFRFRDRSPGRIGNNAHYIPLRANSNTRCAGR